MFTINIIIDFFSFQAYSVDTDDYYINAKEGGIFMTLELTGKEIVYLYGLLKKDLDKLETAESSSSVKTDIKYHKILIKKLETSVPRLKNLPII